MDPKGNGLAVQRLLTVHEGSVLLAIEPVLEPDDVVVAEAGREPGGRHDPDADPLAADAGAFMVPLALDQLVESLDRHRPIEPHNDESRHAGERLARRAGRRTLDATRVSPWPGDACGLARRRFDDGLDAEAFGDDDRPTQSPGACRPASTSRGTSRCCRPGRHRARHSIDGDFSIGGEVERAAEWTWDEFMAPASEDVTVDIHCVTKWTKLDTAWRGVSVDTLLDGRRDRGRVRDRSTRTAATRRTCRSTDLTGGKAWVAYHYDGEPLEPEHGGPARLVVPHLYFWKSAKWVRGLS